MLKMVEAYIEAINFTDGGPDSEWSDGAPFSDDLIKTAQDDCRDFLQAIEATDMIDDLQLSDVQLGCDFWLTRNGHGAGFWDRGLGELGDRLTQLAQAFGEQQSYEGDDGQIYLT